MFESLFGVERETQGHRRRDLRLENKFAKSGTEHRTSSNQHMFGASCPLRIEHLASCCNMRGFAKRSPLAILPTFRRGNMRVKVDGRVSLWVSRAENAKGYCATAFTPQKKQQGNIFFFRIPTPSSRASMSGNHPSKWTGPPIRC